MNYGYDNQYSTVSYGATGGAGAGGFMANGSQDAGAGGGGKVGKDTLRPVTVKQINDAVQPHPDADFKIDNAEVSQVTFVGQIRNISSQVTNYTYKIDDGTGTVEVKMWIDPESGEGGEGSAKKQFQENDYVRVYGTLKQFNNKRHVGARAGSGIKAVTDMNEVNYHLLEATAVHLHFAYGPPEGNKAQTNDANGGGQYGGAGGNGPVVGGRQLPAGLTQGAKRVFQCLHDTPQSNEGLHMQDIAARLGLDMADVHKAGDELLTNALIYTTVDDSTWAILDDI